ncbi:uncharacterized protein LOC106773329 [Vigna radiata var. radiata]|uniref:Uncharacterized protein LOC106773329 n=1 Tax=Vigna radiata var. radiata TaxID=3916 RepID=A0A1S3VBK3_VIGRR|nr:uncharacterized protein LOC106773329 [Vigna radiata var. radiata]
MEPHLDANGVWEAVEQDYEVAPFPDNPTIAQMKNHKESKLRKSKTKSILFTTVSPVIFNRIMTLKTAHEIWKFLKEEYEGNKRVKGIQALNLVRELEMQWMKDLETIKDYVDKLLVIANKIRLLGIEIPDSRIVHKILVTIPERYEATLTSLENSKDLSTITLAELLAALQAPEQRRLMREEGHIEGALTAKLLKKRSGCFNHKNNNKSSHVFPSCPFCKKNNHPHTKCWWRPDVKCHKCGQLGMWRKYASHQNNKRMYKLWLKTVMKKNFLLFLALLLQDQQKVG